MRSTAPVFFLASTVLMMIMAKINFVLAHLKICTQYSIGNMEKATEYGRPMKPFFIKVPNFWAWADTFWGVWGVFKWFISTHFGTVSPLSMVSINQPLFLQKTKPLYLNPKYLFGIGIWVWVWVWIAKN